MLKNRAYLWLEEDVTILATTVRTSYPWIYVEPCGGVHCDVYQPFISGVQVSHTGIFGSNKKTSVINGQVRAVFFLSSSKRVYFKNKKNIMQENSNITNSINDNTPFHYIYY